MPIYTYRREDGTTFDIKQKFLDDPLEFDPETGQRVVRLVQPAGIIFKGSGFYVNDSKGAAKPGSNGHAKNGNGKEAEAKSDADTSSSKTDNKKNESAAD